jgi:cytochrome c oxidase subunit II
MTAPVGPRLILTVGALAAPLALSGTALAGNGGFGPPPPASPNAEGISASYWFITAFVFGIFLLIETLLVVLVVRYRRSRRPRDVDGPQTHGSSKLELSWTIGPVLVLFAVAVFVFVKLPGIANAPTASASGGDLEITVVGQQFHWQFRYPNGAISINRMRAPAGRPVELTVVAPSWDVNHSWWIPRLGGKIDAIPGRVNSTWFEADEPGVYTGQCAELCGVFHAKMLATVEVMPQSAFDAWLTATGDEQREPNTELGQEIWEGACATCHGLSGEGGYGPALGAATLSNRDAVENAVVNGRALPGRNVMPPIGATYTDTQLESLYAYLEQRFGNTS